MLTKSFPTKIFSEKKKFQKLEQNSDQKDKEKFREIKIFPKKLFDNKNPLNEKFLIKFF